MIYVYYVQVEQSELKMEFFKETYENVSQFKWQNFTDGNLSRQLRRLTELGIFVLPVRDVLKVGDRCGMQAGN